jgi:predicted small secreted protein
MKKLLVILVAALFMVGCNTMSGLGKDIERTGEKIQDKARK